MWPNGNTKTYFRVYPRSKLRNFKLPKQSGLVRKHFCWSWKGYTATWKEMYFLTTVCYDTWLALSTIPFAKVLRIGLQSQRNMFTWVLYNIVMNLYNNSYNFLLFQNIFLRLYEFFSVTLNLFRQFWTNLWLPQPAWSDGLLSNLCLYYGPLMSLTSD